MGLVMVLFWGGLIALLLVAVRAAIGGGSQTDRPAGGSQALDVLARRYAKGEISADEYKEKKDVLRI
jgi:putative membrane protein